MNDTSTDVEEAPNVQVFAVQEILPHPNDDLEQVMRNRLVLTAFDQGYGLVEVPRRATWKEHNFGDYDVVRFRAMGVKLHV